MCNGDSLVQYIFSYEVFTEINPFHLLGGSAFGPVFSTLIVVVKGKYGGVNGNVQTPEKNFQLKN